MIECEKLLGNLVNLLQQLPQDSKYEITDKYTRILKGRKN